MVEVIWRNEALDDLDRIAAYIEQFDGDAADRTRQRLIDCGDSLAIFPRRGRPTQDDRREMTTVPPSILRYRIENEIVFILDIRHGAQRPTD